MAYIGDIISEKSSATPVACIPQKNLSPSGDASWRFLVNIINKREVELLEELLTQNTMQYVVRNGSRKHKQQSNSGFSMLGKDIYVDSSHYDRAKALLADYYLGGEQATAETNTVPAARRQQSQISPMKRYALKKLILWLVLAMVGYTVLFTLWMGMMK